MKLYLADALSLLRIPATVAVLFFSYEGMWLAALIALAAGWCTDLMDGIAAKKFGSLRDDHPNFDADGLADSALAFGTSLVPIGYAVHHTGWSWISVLLLTVYAATLISAGWMVSIMGKPASRVKRLVVAFNMIVMHGAIQIVAVLLWFSYMAFGYYSAFVTVSALVTITVYQQRAKVLLWWGGRLT